MPPDVVHLLYAVLAPLDSSATPRGRGQRRRRQAMRQQRVEQQRPPGASRSARSNWYARM
jgi:hypothetical protein